MTNLERLKRLLKGRKSEEQLPEEVDRILRHNDFLMRPIHLQNALKGLESKKMEGLIEGRMVHLVERGCHLAAVVNEVIDAEKGIVGLTVFNRVSDIRQHNLPPTFPVSNVPYDAGAVSMGTWHWIERA